MTPRIFCLIAAAVFSLIALGHAIRLLFGWHVTVENIVVPFWISWIGLAIAGYLAYASRLGLKRATFITRMKKLGVNPNMFSERDGVGSDIRDSSASSTSVLP